MTHRTFALSTGEGADLLADDQPVASVTDVGVGFFSAANDHTATVRVEFWDTEPANDTSGTAPTVHGTVDLPTPFMALVTLDTGFIRTIPAPFTGPAGVRVRCTGRDEAARLSFEDNEAFFEDVEQWHVAVWPRR